MFCINNLSLSKTGCQKFATSLFNFISSCSTSKWKSFDLRKVEKSVPLKTNTHISIKKNVHHFKNITFVYLSIFINHLHNVYMFVKLLYLYLLLRFVLLALPFLFQAKLVNQFWYLYLQFLLFMILLYKK